MSWKPEHEPGHSPGPKNVAAKGHQQPPLAERIVAVVIRVVFGLTGLCMIVAFGDTKLGHALANTLRSMIDADQRVIIATAGNDSVGIVQRGPDTLTNCTVTVNEDFAYRAGDISPEFAAIFPLREFALDNGLRFDTHRYKVQQVRLRCDGLSRSIEPQG
jgi:hypothetical protein